MSDLIVPIPPIPAEVFEAEHQLRRDIEAACGVYPQKIGTPEKGDRR